MGNVNLIIDFSKSTHTLTLRDIFIYHSFKVKYALVVKRSCQIDIAMNKLQSRMFSQSVNIKFSVDIKLN